jgi:hypothetical protein
MEILGEKLVQKNKGQNGFIESVLGRYNNWKKVSKDLSANL